MNPFSIILLVFAIIVQFPSLLQARLLLPDLVNVTHLYLDSRDVAALAGDTPPGPPPEPPHSPPSPSTEPYLTLVPSADDTTWEKARCKGAAFMRAMRGSDEEAGQVFSPAQDSAASAFDDLDNAEGWGWKITDHLLNTDYEAWGITRILNELDISDRDTTRGGTIECLMLTHGYDLDEDGNEIIAEESYMNDDWQTFRKTGAHYGFGIDPHHGVIIAMDRESPQSAGKRREPPIESDQIPAFSASSDAAWVLWKYVTEEATGNLGNLKHFLSLSITNRETLSILARTVRNVDPDAETYPLWEGYELDTNTAEGQAILGTPNAKAFSYLLLQHKRTLGNLYISRVHVFRDDREHCGLNLYFKVELAPFDGMDWEPQDMSNLFSDFAHARHVSRTKGLLEASSNNVVNTTALGDLPPALPLVVPPKPWSREDGGFLDLYENAEDDEWETTKCKGAAFVRAMRGTDSDAGQIFDPPRDTAAGAFGDTHLDALTDWGWELGSTEGINMHQWGIDHMLRDMGMSDRVENDGGDIRLVSFAHGLPKDDNGQTISIDMQSYDVEGKMYRHTGAHYVFGLDEVNGVMIAIDRLSPQEAGKRRQPAVEGADELPLIRTFSDMAWISWKELAKVAESDLKNIHYFMSLSITNAQTRRILSRAVREAVPGAWGFPDWGGIEFDTSSPQGQAILGTPNAQAFSYFLLQHKEDLGNLYISKVRVFRDSRQMTSQPNLLLVVEPVPAGGDEEPEEPVEASSTPQSSARKVAVSMSHRLRRWWTRSNL